jgi:hypothetical protein
MTVAMTQMYVLREKECRKLRRAYLPILFSGSRGIAISGAQDGLKMDPPIAIGGTDIQLISSRRGEPG